MSLSTIPSSYGETVNEPKVYEQHKKFSAVRGYGPEFEENGRNILANTIEMKSKLNNEDEGKMFLSP